MGFFAYKIHLKDAFVIIPNMTLKCRLSDLTGILVSSQCLISGTIDIRDETLVPLIPPPDASGFPPTLHLLLCLPGLKGSCYKETTISENIKVRALETRVVAVVVSDIDSLRKLQK
ncbi:hypothetical protein QJS10_CPB11g01383 [Acorus calamus]|uniref:Uncharacterized protein n=1 Tax=Acorus calamus TaxID=4465 RepID=A0AAV9DT24_ACOCL|nr:hypothetical protein QJS10_CPB11g01383 [Acorus calamus]